MSTLEIILNSLVAIGTIGASGVALWLWLKDKKRHLSIEFSWDETTHDLPKVFILNDGGKVEKIESIVADFDKTSILNKNFDDYQYSFEDLVLVPGNTTIIKLEILDRALKFQEKQSNENKYDLKVSAFTASDKCFSITKKYTYDEVYNMFAVNGLNADLYE